MGGSTCGDASGGETRRREGGGEAQGARAQAQATSARVMAVRDARGPMAPGPRRERDGDGDGDGKASVLSWTAGNETGYSWLISKSDITFDNQTLPM